MYDSPHQFTPLLPSPFKQEALLAKAHDLSRAALALSSHPMPTELRGLLRGMNSYYTNRIEGQHTRPMEIEQALRRDFSGDAVLAAKQRLAVAHIEAEVALEARFVTEEDAHQLFSPEAISDLHQTLFARLPEADLRMPNGEVIVPGQLRQREVSVGRHIAPSSASVPLFLQHWASAYGAVRRGEAQLLAVAAAHQRLGWIHPFVDGNGRVMRLHTHAWLGAAGYTKGLWSPLRGFARSTDKYYELLAAADEPRLSDWDGRGNLSESALVAWTDYVLDVCLDQVTFMARLLDVSTLQQRIAACLSFEENTLKSGVRSAATHALHYLFLRGTEMERGEFKALLGLGDRTASGVLAALLKRELLKSDSPYGKVRFGVPLHALRFYFPALWPEAEADVATSLSKFSK